MREKGPWPSTPAKGFPRTAEGPIARGGCLLKPEWNASMVPCFLISLVVVLLYYSLLLKIICSRFEFSSARCLEVINDVEPWQIKFTT